MRACSRRAHEDNFSSQCCGPEAAINVRHGGNDVHVAAPWVVVLHPNPDARPKMRLVGEVSMLSLPAWRPRLRYSSNRSGEYYSDSITGAALPSMHAARIAHATMT